MNPDTELTDRIVNLEKALEVLAMQKLSTPVGGSVIDIQARATITFLIKAIKDLAISL
jgi:hypothetical protein